MSLLVGSSKDVLLLVFEINILLILYFLGHTCLSWQVLVFWGTRQQGNMKFTLPSLICENHAKFIAIKFVCGWICKDSSRWRCRRNTQWTGWCFCLNWKPIHPGELANSTSSIVVCRCPALHCVLYRHAWCIISTILGCRDRIRNVGYARCYLENLKYSLISILL